MRQLAVIAALIGCMAASETRAQGASGYKVYEDGDDVLFVRSDSRPVAPLFSFASASPGYRGYAVGAGLPAADGCYAAASVTGTKGEALTFTRATTRFCPTDGTTNESTGVMCSSGQVCITSLSSRRGISIFRAGTNRLIRSEELDNAAWSNITAGAGTNPTLNGANAGVAPDGATTAEDYTFPATGAADASARGVSAGCAGGSTPVSEGIWVKGVSGSGTLDLCLTANGTGPVVVCAACAFTSTAWALCKNENITYTSNGTYFVGNASAYNGGTTRPQNRVYLWGGSCFSSAPYLTPYIATTGASATRNKEVPSIAIPSTASWPSSYAATLTGGHLANVTGYVSTFGNSASVYYIMQATSASNFQCAIANTSSAVDNNTHSFSSSASRFACSTTAATVEAYVNGVGSGSPTSHAISSFNETALEFGDYTSYSPQQPDGILSDVCFDSSPTRCIGTVN